MITQLIIYTHFDVSTAIGGLLQELNVQWSLLARWRGEQTVPYVTYSVAPLVSVHSWFRLPNPDGFFYPTRTHVSLFIHHFRSLPVYHTVASVRMSVMADWCSTFVEHFLASRVKRLDVTDATVSSSDH